MCSALLSAKSCGSATDLAYAGSYLEARRKWGERDMTQQPLQLQVLEYAVVFVVDQ